MGEIIAEGEENQLSDEVFAFKRETLSGIPSRFQRDGQYFRRLKGIGDRAVKLPLPLGPTTIGLRPTRQIQLGGNSGQVSEGSHHPRTWVFGDTNDSTSTESALKRFTIPGALVEDGIASSTPGHNESNGDSKQTCEKIQTDALRISHGVSHRKNEEADALPIEEETLPDTRDPTGRPEGLLTLGQKLIIQGSTDSLLLKETLSTYGEDSWILLERDEKIDENDEWCVL